MVMVYCKRVERYTVSCGSEAGGSGGSSENRFENEDEGGRMRSPAHGCSKRKQQFPADVEIMRLLFIPSSKTEYPLKPLGDQPDVVRSWFCCSDQPAEAEGHDTQTELPEKAGLMLNAGVEVGAGKIEVFITTESVASS